MLSTQSILDVKATLFNDYSHYNYDSDEQFERAIENALHDTMLLDMIPLLGSSEYETIRAKDKVDLNTDETMIYWGEVNIACARVANNNQDSSSSFSFSVEGYSESRSDSSSISGNQSLGFYNKGCGYLANAGYMLNTIQLR